MSKLEILHNQIDETRDSVEQIYRDLNQPAYLAETPINHELEDLVGAVVRIREMLLECYQCTETQETRAHKELSKAVKAIYKANSEILKVHECMAKATSVLNKPSK